MLFNAIEQAPQPVATARGRGDRQGYRVRGGSQVASAFSLFSRAVSWKRRDGS